MHASPSVELLAPLSPSQQRVIPQAALDFAVALHRRFNAARHELLQARAHRQADIDAGQRPDFLPHTAHLRAGDWVADPIPDDLQDRRVEITGPVDRKMVINALNSGARVFMADFEDANSPTWDNCIEGQVNLYDAVRRTIAYTNEAGKRYELHPQPAVLMVRPRGWHLAEKHLRVDGQPMSASLFDAGLYLYLNAAELLARGTGPYLYLPKLESHLEARLWNDVFVYAQEALGIPQGSIKATVLIETITATFELHEIIYELRHHMAGLNCGRWDYIFSYIKKFRHLGHAFILPDRSQVSMAVPFMSAYSKLVIQTCHRRRVHAMGGMAAFIPIKNDPEANAAALEKVRQDKLREVTNGHDGTWVAHPALVPVALEVFDAHMPTPHNYAITRQGETYTQADLLAQPQGTITEAGLRMNINVGILYLESWLRGLGAAAIHNLMEDAATAEISRTQVWQWIRYGATLDDGRQVSYALFQEILPSELDAIRAYIGDERYFAPAMQQAVELFDRLVQPDEYQDFLTLRAYEAL